MTNDIPGLAARRGALTLLQAVLWQGRALDAALPRALRALDDPADRGLARNIAATVLRWLPDLDAMIDAQTRKRLPDDARARMVLRMALAQALLLETPAHAVVATALPLVEGGPRRLVHGVLSSALRAAEEDARLPDSPSLPQPWAERWRASWGEDMVAAAAAALALPAPLDLSLKPGAPVPEGAMSLAPDHARLPAGTRIEELPGFADGAFWAQDLAASLPVRLLEPRFGETVLDLCAAPGGKTMQLAATGAMVTAIDNSSHRLARLRDNLDRTKLSAEIVEADAGSATGEYDAVLLDAPCSATGIFRRHPDVLHLRDPESLEAVTGLQAKLLDHAATLVKPGGRLLYAVCSLEREEGEAQVEAFRARNPGWRLEACEIALPAGVTQEPGGIIRTLPGQVEGGLDGFFMARLTKA